MTSAVKNPAKPTLRRKLLALRVIALASVIAVSWVFIIGWADDLNLGLPKWAEVALALVAVLPFFSCFLAIVHGIPDLVVHVVPEGRLRRFLLWGDRSPETIAREFEESGYSLALLPVYLVLGIAALGLVLVLSLGGFALLGHMFSGLFAGWPSWAIVITILLVAILFKK